MLVHLKFLLERFLATPFEIFEDRIGSNWHGKWIGAVRPGFINSDLYPISEESINS